MKVRESGMPEEAIWSQFFDIELILSELQINSVVKDMAEIGCGYGTFTIPASLKISGKLFGFDIEKSMIELVRKKLYGNCISNVVLEKKDVVKDSTGLSENSMDYVMLFNILHHHLPGDFLNEAYRILKPKGKIGIIHWRSDISTPRGPDLSIRPTPENILQMIDPDLFIVEKQAFWLPPYHYGMIISKK
jgi:SAM-dependent methyltransferase